MSGAISKTPALRRASLPRRLLAFAVDMAIVWFASLLLLVPLLLTLSDPGGQPDYQSQPQQTELSDLWWAPVLMVVLTAVFGATWRVGRSPGVAALGIRMVAVAGGHPSWRAALARGFFTVLFLLASFISLSAGFSDNPGGYNAIDLSIIFGSLAVLTGSSCGYVWLLWDKDGQALQDRLTGVKVARD